MYRHVLFYARDTFLENTAQVENTQIGTQNSHLH